MTEQNGRKARPNPEATGWIDDGMTQLGYVAAVPFRHQGVQFEYRQMLPTERARIRQELRDIGPEQGEELCATLLAARITWWDFKTSKGEIADFQDAAVYTSHMYPPLFARLLEIVGDFGTTDIHPDWGKNLRKDTASDELTAAIHGHAEPSQPEN